MRSIRPPPPCPPGSRKRPSWLWVPAPRLPAGPPLAIWLAERRVIGLGSRPPPCRQAIAHRARRAHDPSGQHLALPGIGAIHVFHKEVRMAGQDVDLLVGL